MEIAFRTKEESKREQEAAFLALSPHERFLSFVALSKAVNKLYPAKHKVNNKHFVVDLSKMQHRA
jgi:hypothetical protein